MFGDTCSARYSVFFVALAHGALPKLRKVLRKPRVRIIKFHTSGFLHLVQHRILLRFSVFFGFFVCRKLVSDSKERKVPSTIDF